jgi:putative SOS response-associated peptidase YedK
MAEFLVPADDALLEAFELEPKINNPANDNPEILEPLRGSLLL